MFEQGGPIKNRSMDSLWRAKISRTIRSARVVNINMEEYPSGEGACLLNM